MNAKPIGNLLLTCLTALLLTACGSGGSSGSDSSADTGGTLESASTPPTTTTTTPPPPTSNTSSSTSVTSSGGAVTTQWSIPTRREDGSPLLASDLSGYEIYYYKSGSNQSQGTVIAINNPNQTSHTTGMLSAGTYYFAISSIDSDGVYSQLSNYVAVTVP